VGFWPFKRESRRDVPPNATAIILYGRFQEHLEDLLEKWNDQPGLSPEARLTPEQIEALREVLNEYFQAWFQRGFPPARR
jgi:hypothetical protein